MRHEQFFLFIDLQQRLAAKPVDQVIGIWCLEQRVILSFGLLRLIPAKPPEDADRDAQHHPYIVAQRFYKAQNVKGAWTARHQITRQPERHLTGVKSTCFNNAISSS
jgi:hypothetical protein